MKNQTNEFSKSFSQPDERRDFVGHGHLDLVQFGNVSIGRAEFEPGWRWDADVKPLAGTDSCQADHSGYCLGGSMVIKMDDGKEFTVREGDAFHIPPGHNAWVEGKEKCVMLDVGGFQAYAKSQAYAKPQPDAEGKWRKAAG